jgi:DNA polymerase-3 subunit chi
LFDGSDDAATASARERWKHYKEQNHALAYFKQTTAGGWEKAA